MRPVQHSTVAVGLNDPGKSKFNGGPTKYANPAPSQVFLVKIQLKQGNQGNMRNLRVAAVF